MNFVAKLLLFATAILSGSAATAGQLVLNSGVEQVTLLELYTSQGCSSCPPAERWLNSYVDSDELWTKTVPLAFHVDYWDYLGWKDSLADSAAAAPGGAPTWTETTSGLLRSISSGRTSRAIGSPRDPC